MEELHTLDAKTYVSETWVSSKLCVFSFFTVVSRISVSSLPVITAVTSLGKPHLLEGAGCASLSTARGSHFHCPLTCCLHGGAQPAVCSEWSQPCVSCVLRDWKIGRSAESWLNVTKPSISPLLTVFLFGPGDTVWRGLISKHGFHCSLTLQRAHSPTMWTPQAVGVLLFTVFLSMSCLSPVLAPSGRSNHSSLLGTVTLTLSFKSLPFLTSSAISSPASAV